MTVQNAPYREYKLKDESLFRITDKNTGAVSVGGDQEWYGRVWQRLSGCGPTAASNIFKYLSASCLPAGTIRTSDTRDDFRALMKEIWRFVTPTRHGVNSTDLFSRGCIGFAESRSFRVVCESLDIPAISSSSDCSNDIKRPTLAQIVSFIARALDSDIPVAFLSLDSGSEKAIDHWHWITVIAMHGTEDDMKIDFLDAGTIKHASLSGWYRTTKEGGGFVSVMPEPAMAE